MVFSSDILKAGYDTYRAIEKFRKYRFLDSLRIVVRGGAGGMGLPKYGGIGGKGGDVIVKAKEDLTLNDVKKKYTSDSIKASVGNNAHSRCILGSPGKNHIVEIPSGVTVYDADGRLIGEVNKPGQFLIVARGGIGGCADTGYSGLKGEIHRIQLELKLIADIGLVGFPNAGKSTLLKAITNAKPKIAAYPFTTIRPNIGIIEYKDKRQISLADLPGLIEGAHTNIGMGHRFLRHVERTKLLLLVVDICGFQLSHKHEYRTCLDTIVLLNKELELYKEELLGKPAMLVLNKMDVEGAWDKFEEIKDSLHNMRETILKYPKEIRPFRALNFDQIVPISAKTSARDISNLRDVIRTYLDIYSSEQHNYAEEENQLIERLHAKLAEFGPRLA